VRDGLRQALQQPGRVAGNSVVVVAEAENGLQALAAVKQHRPDLILLDVSMPLAGGAEVVCDIRRWSPQTRIVILTGINAPVLIANLLQQGVEGMFSEGAPLDELYTKLPLILRGGHYIADEFVQSIAAHQHQNQLTERELQTLNMILSGKPNREIAEQWSISPKTADKHRISLMQKLEVHSVAELMAYALKHGLIDVQNLS
jgi:DNA-binding NarL/FixJ family response regulator